MLYVNGMIITIAAGGAFSDNRESLFTNEASSAAGKCLQKTILLSLQTKQL